MLVGLSDTGIECAREIQKNVSVNARQYGWTERMRTQRAILANTASSCIMASSALMCSHVVLQGLALTARPI